MGVFFYILIRIYSYLQAIQLGAYSPTPEVETPIMILWNKTFFCPLPETHCDNIQIDSHSFLEG